MASLVEDSHFERAAELFNQESQDVLNREALGTNFGLRNAKGKQLQYAIGFAHGVRNELQPAVYKELYANIAVSF